MINDLTAFGAALAGVLLFAPAGAAELPIRSEYGNQGVCEDPVCEDRASVTPTEVRGYEWGCQCRFIASAAAQSHSPEHPIDRQLRACVDRHHTTAGMAKCAHAAHDRWDAAMNAAYRQLMSGLDPASQAKLRQAQRAWLRYRDAQFAFLGSFHAKQEGTMHVPIGSASMMQVVKSRALQLEASASLMHGPMQTGD